MSLITKTILVPEEHELKAVVAGCDGLRTYQVSELIFHQGSVSHPSGLAWIEGWRTEQECTVRRSMTTEEIANLEEIDRYITLQSEKKR